MNNKTILAAQHYSTRVPAPTSHCLPVVQGPALLQPMGRKRTKLKIGSRVHDDAPIKLAHGSSDPAKTKTDTFRPKLTLCNKNSNPMSNSDLEEPPNNGWFASESELPGISSLDSTQTLGVIMSSPSANRNIGAIDFGDGSVTGPTPNRGIPVVHAPLGGTGPGNGENFLDAPTHTPSKRVTLTYAVECAHNHERLSCTTLIS